MHAVLIVDCSGSMRNDDVPGYATRTQAVYNCLVRAFVEPQLKGPDGAGSVVVTLIEMQTTPRWST
jgi:hypothetical protein